MFFTVKIVDTIIQRANTLEHRLVEYQVAAPTGATARIQALEHHLARPDRGPTAAVRWASVGPIAAELERIVKISEKSIDLGELRALEEEHHPYVVA